MWVFVWHRGSKELATQRDLQIKDLWRGIEKWKELTGSEDGGGLRSVGLYF